MLELIKSLLRELTSLFDCIKNIGRFNVWNGCNKSVSSIVNNKCLKCDERTQIDSLFEE